MTIRICTINVLSKALLLERNRMHHQVSFDQEKSQRSRQIFVSENALNLLSIVPFLDYELSVEVFAKSSY